MVREIGKVALRGDIGFVTVHELSLYFLKFRCDFLKLRWDFFFMNSDGISRNTPT